MGQEHGGAGRYIENTGRIVQSEDKRWTEDAQAGRREEGRNTAHGGWLICNHEDHVRMAGVYSEATLTAETASVERHRTVKVNSLRTVLAKKTS